LTVQVERGAYQGELVPVKTRASRRRVDLSSTAAHLLRRQLLARTPNERGLIFPSPRGALLNDDNFRHRVFRPAVRRSGLTGLRFHDLRHTYAALMVAAGAQEQPDRRSCQKAKQTHHDSFLSSPSLEEA
jgi:integrase